MFGKKVLSVGQCAADHGSISGLLRRHFGAEVIAAATGADAAARLRRGGIALVLVNRVLDDDGASGLDVIAAIKQEPALAAVPVMLVSNIPEPQQQAAALGALPGFGKASLGDPGMLARLHSVLGDAPQPPS